MTTIRLVAKLCGVAPMTVSHVLNNAPGKVSEETRERVLRVVRELDYRPAARGRSHPRQQINTLGVASDMTTDPSQPYSYYNFILHGVLAGGYQQQQNVTLFNNRLLWTNTTKAIRAYCDGRCDGLILIAPPGGALAGALWERGFPFITVGGALVQGYPDVDVDNRAAARVAVTYLLEQGHRRIALLKGPEAHDAIRQRERGYRDALAGYGLTPDESLMPRGDYSEKLSEARTRALLERPLGERPTAVFCGNDVIAFGAWRAARAMGRRVPDDLSIIGFDDGLQATETDPPLTTVRQPYQQIGIRAVEMLLAQVRGETDILRQELLPGELIVRGSVSPPAAR